MIYDVFPFFQELELLDIRLNVHGPYVDKFVLIESEKTHTGVPKPLHYHSNRHLFEPFNDRIIHVVAEQRHSDNPWQNERDQRDAAFSKLSVEASDVFILSDVDEIVNFETIGHCRRAGLVGLRMKMYYYYVNLFLMEWDYPKMFSGDVLLGAGGSFQALRVAHPDSRIERAGWHFSYLGGWERIRDKIKTQCDTQFNTPDITDSQNLQNRILAGEDILCRAWPDFKLTKVAMNEENQPRYILDNQSKFSHLILP